MSPFLSIISRFFLSINSGRGAKAYIQSWAEEIKDNPTILFQVIKEANQICDFVVENGQLEAVREEVKEEELIDLGGAIHDLALEYDTESVSAGPREDRARFVAENIRQGDTVPFPPK